MGLIVNILNTVAVEKLKHPDKKPINITNVKKVLLPAYNEYCLLMPGSTCDTGMYPLFINKGFLVNLKTERNASKFAMFMEKENPRSFFRFSFRATFIFPL